MGSMIMGHNSDEAVTSNPAKMAEKLDSVETERFLGYLKSSARPSKAVGVVTEVFLIASNKEDFVREQLNELRESGQGIFSRLKHQKDDYLEYQCERHNKPRGRSSGLSTQTRANRCTAFVSFKFVCQGAATGCVRRLRCRHNGHDPFSKKEKCVGAIDKDVTSIIETLAFNGKNPSDIMKAIKLRAIEKGHRDVNDRRFHPSIQDVNNILKSYRKHIRFDSSDLLCVEQLLKHDLGHSCLSYHPLLLPAAHAGGSAPYISQGGKSSRFHVTLQSPEQAEYLQKESGECRVAFITLCGSDGVLREKPLRKCSDKEQGLFSVYVISIPSLETLYSVPVASILTEQGNEGALVAGLMALRGNHPHFYPSAFMMERDEHLTSSIKLVWPDATLLWSWPTVLQIASDWVTSGKCSQSGDSSTCFRHLLLRSMWRLKLCSTKRQFARKTWQLFHRMDKLTALSPPARKKFHAYLETEWIPCADRWSDFGRSFLVAQWSDLHVQLAALDRLFLKQQLQFGPCGFTQKLDFLLLMLHHSTNIFFTTLRDLQTSHHRGNTGTSTITDSPCHHPQTSCNCGKACDCLHKLLKCDSEGGKAVRSSEEDAVWSYDGVFAGTSYSSDSVGHSENCHHTCNAKHQPLVGCHSKQHSSSVCGITDQKHTTAGACHLDLSPYASSERKLDLMSGKLAKSGNRLATGKREMDGELARAVWLSEGVCLVPSDTSLFVSWRVDFISMLCSCPSALIAGTCKHLHVEPSKREEKIFKQRKTVASDIVMKGWYHYQDGKLYVVSCCNYLYTVDATGQSDHVVDASDQLEGRSSIPCAPGGRPCITVCDCVMLVLQSEKGQGCLDDGCRDNGDIDEADCSDRDGDDDDDVKYGDELMEQEAMTARGQSVQLRCDEDDRDERSKGRVDVESIVQYEEVVEEVVEMFHITDHDMTGLVTDSVTGGINDVTGLVSDIVAGGVSGMTGLTSDEIKGGDSDMTRLVNDDMTGKVSDMVGVGEEVVTVGTSSVTPSKLLLSLSAPPTGLTTTTKTPTPSQFVPQALSQQTLHCGHAPNMESTGIINADQEQQTEVIVVLPSTATGVSQGASAAKTVVSVPQASRGAEKTISENSTIKSSAGQPCVKRDSSACSLSTPPLTSPHKALTMDSLPGVVWAHQAGLHPDLAHSPSHCTGTTGTATHPSGSSPPPVKTSHNLHNDRHTSGLSTRRMIEELAAWARSGNFADSVEVKSAVAFAFDMIFSGKMAKRQSQSTESASLMSEELCVEKPVACASNGTQCETSGTGPDNTSCTQQVVASSDEEPGTNMIAAPFCAPLPTSSHKSTTSPHTQSLQQKEMAFTFAEHETKQTCNSQKPSLQQSTSRSQDYSEHSSVEVIHIASNTKTCLDDLVRRLEARQQEGENGCHPSPSPAKKPRMQKACGTCDLPQVEQVGVVKPPQAQECDFMGDPVDIEKIGVVSKDKTQECDAAGDCDKLLPNVEQIEVLELPSSTPSGSERKTGSGNVTYVVQSDQDGEEGDVIYIVTV